MQYPSINRLAELQQLIADFAKIERMPHLADNGRRENDVEHSFGLALTCWYLQPMIAPELNLSQIFQYALAHDLVEIYAGDTFVFDAAGMASKDGRERDAVARLRAEWPDFPALNAATEGYMNRENEEAKFVKAVDKILPVLMIELGLANDSFWHTHSITLADERENKVSIYVSDHVRPYYDKLITWLDERGNIPKQ